MTAPNGTQPNLMLTIMCCISMDCVRPITFPCDNPLTNPHGRLPILRHYVQSSPHLFDRSSMAKQNLSHRANVICDGSPSRILMVRRISLGMTTRPRSSIRLTIPVAFIVASNGNFLGFGPIIGVFPAFYPLSASEKSGNRNFCFIFPFRCARTTHGFILLS